MGQKLWKNISEASTTTASYVLSSVGYTTDVVVTFVGGIAVGVALCSPIVALEAMAKSQSSQSSSPSAECII